MKDDEKPFNRDATMRAIARACAGEMSAFKLHTGGIGHGDIYFEHRRDRSVRVQVDVRFKYNGFTGNPATNHAVSRIKSVTLTGTFRSVRPLVLTAVHKQDDPGAYVAAKLAEFVVKVVDAMNVERAHKSARTKYLGQVRAARERVFDLCGGFGVVPATSEGDPSRYRATFGTMKTSGKVQEPELDKYTLAFENLTLAQLEHLFATAARMAKQDPDGTNEPSK